MRDGKIEPRDKRFIMVRLQGHLPCPTPLLEQLTREFSSLCQQAPLWRSKPYTPIYTPQLHHNLITPYTQLLHTYLSSHLSTLQLSISQQSSSQLSTSQQSSSQLSTFRLSTS
jgi:hypothetical protein